MDDTITDVAAFPEVVQWARTVCGGLPDAYEQEAWVGTRWRVRSNTFAHVLEIVDGYPPSFAAAPGTDGPATVLTFRASGHELDAVLAGTAFFGPLWNRGDVGVLLDLHHDWNELAELLVESYRLRAPTRLVRVLDTTPGTVSDAIFSAPPATGKLTVSRRRPDD